ncbi:predicted protein [Nematostella vectensis]|uniref:Signal peptidase complex subunit 2 n=1 Tax=Nematostella vectensis TaxID=45351 RepID=A7RZ11_NEMVE|nr:signal peptidase complex subunit 2 [Nematostella vectensis]EDO43323.1 predicted protein [Nematostella vectensis]|eukprot:XP_001635386.1 predicted protein [Nematostella vectensis]
MASKKSKNNWGLSTWTVDPEKPVKVDKWDGNAVKNALDDAAKKVLTERFGYQEDHKLTDIRLGICTISCLFALGALAYDYLYPFPASKPALIFCVLSYFTMMTILTMFTTFKEKNYIMFAIEKDDAGVGPDHMWTLRSSLKRYDPNYMLTMSYKDGETNREREQSLEKSVASWFDENGVLIFELFEKDVKELHQSLCAEKKDK